MLGIYLISPPQIEDITIFTQQLEEIFFLQSKPKIFQLRLKHTDLFLIEEAILKIKPICEKYNVEFVLNDDISLAIKHDIGVHVGEGATMADILNFKKQSQKLIGVSCYNDVARAEKFAPYASYVSFGAMFPSATKTQAKQCEVSTVKDFRKINNAKVGVIGGITAENISTIEEILPFIDYICVISCIWENS